MESQAQKDAIQRLMKSVRFTPLGAIGQARCDQEYEAAQAAIHAALTASVSEEAIFNRIHDGERGWPSEKIGSLVPRPEVDIAVKQERTMQEEAKKPRPNYTQDVTNKVIALMEGEGLKPWDVSWDRGLTKAFNPYTREKGRQGREYRGANALNLLMAQLGRDSADPRWLTFNQAKDAGFSIRKGARAESVMYWQFPDQKEQKVEWNAGTNSPSGCGVFQLKGGKYAAYFGDLGWMKEADTFDEARDMTIKGSRFRNAERFQWAAVDEMGATATNGRPKPIFALVFNGADISGMPPMKERRVFDANERAERLIQATGAVIEHRELARVGKGFTVNMAYYDSKADQITVPPRGHFKCEGDYYRTLVHEIAHWTGHESRLNRGLDEAKRGTPEYAWEELRAEMASAMICSALGVDGGLADHAAYLDEYVKLLKEDRSAIFKAARDAEKIYNAVFEFDPELRAEVEGHLADNAISTADPNAKKQQVVDFKKIIKADLPSFAPIKPTVESVAEAPVAAPVQPLTVETKPEASPPTAVPTPVSEVDIEIDFGDLRLNDEAETRVAAGTVQTLDDEIGLDDFEITAAFDGEFDDIEVGGPTP